MQKLFNDLARVIAMLHLDSGRASEETTKAIRHAYGPCTVDASCEDENHTYSWPCDYAAGTGGYAR